ncbi:hypothetical protein [Sphingomonas cavernae]|uniref:Uncharacterized protein n=1 Tax=Sphingomonas cavernae TaxID=2320861 RepID=A0A418WKA6_9SPHN|nr:hypothetical protein [Sphingomonas cavernae]RJF90474.1 hypothetical protein D3876_09555 [Sphingomonas cavernae]
MALLRSVIFGGIVAVAVPTLAKGVGGPFGDFMWRTSSHIEVGDTWIRFNAGLFAIVAILTFGFLQIWRSR